MRKPTIDNREAAAYAVFRSMQMAGNRWFGRDQALTLLDSIVEVVPSVAKVFAKEWRKARHQGKREAR